MVLSYLSHTFYFLHLGWYLSLPLTFGGTVSQWREACCLPPTARSRGRRLLSCIDTGRTGKQELNWKCLLKRCYIAKKYMHTHICLQAPMHIQADNTHKHTHVHIHAGTLTKAHTHCNIFLSKYTLTSLNQQQKSFPIYMQQSISKLRYVTSVFLTRT